MDSISFEGKTAIVTGASSGIGKEIAHELAKRGCRVIVACRNEADAVKTVETIEKDPEVGRNKLVFYKLALDSLDSVRDFAATFLQKEEKLDYLINNAGLFTNRRKRTLDGFEMMMAVNYIGHYLLTDLLLNKLKESGSSRIINIVCKAYEKGEIDLEDFNFQKNWRPMLAFGRSKKALLMHTLGLSKELQGVTSLAVDPGPTRTKFFNRARGCDKCMSCLSCSPNSHKRALDIIFCCSEPTLVHKPGKLFRNRKEVELNTSDLSEMKAKELWIATRQMLNLEVTD